LADGNDGGCQCCGAATKRYSLIPLKKLSMFSWEYMLICRSCYEDPGRIDIEQTKKRLAESGQGPEDVELAGKAILKLMEDRLGELIKLAEDALLFEGAALKLRDEIEKQKASL
jgi:hypothetical protein